MEKKLRTCYNHLAYLRDTKEIAASMRELLVSDLDKLKNEYSSFINLDNALQNYFIRREYRYAIQLLENFLNHGDLQTDNSTGMLIHYPERYKRIKEVIAELLGVAYVSQGFANSIV